MKKEDLENYIRLNLKRGLSLEEIRQKLLSSGFFDYDIDEAISKLDLKKVSKKEGNNLKPKKVESIEGWDKELQ